MTRFPLMALVLAAACAAQTANKDFLTGDEIDQIRNSLGPSQRMELYTGFARQRLDQVQQLVAKEKAGRSILIHDLLDQYTKIIDAIDTVSDDALQRKSDIAEGTKIVADAEKEFLPVLEKIQESGPKDLSRYQFSLTQAIETTRDSLELAQEDLGTRTDEVTARAKKEKQEREALMNPKDLEAKRAEEKKSATEKRKRPTLLKKGETVKEQ